MRYGVKLGFLFFVFAILTSIVIQDHTDVLPLGLFNTASQPYIQLANGCLVLITAIFVILLVEAWRNKRGRLAAALRGGLLMAVATELLLVGVDRLFVSRNLQSSLGGPYYEKETSEGTWVFLKKAHAGSPLGFRTDHPYTPVPEHRRILFLGDSYTEGSGHSSACNYPNVVEKVLRQHLGDVEVMNAGVAGYGPVAIASTQSCTTCLRKMTSRIIFSIPIDASWEASSFEFRIHGFCGHFIR
jgi:hypothetical protein